MDNIIFSSKEDMEDLFDNLRVLGSGSEGICYKNKKLVYKKYNEMYIDLYDNDIAIDRLLRFRNIIIENIYFIRSLIYLDNLMIGSISEYASGINCSKKMLFRCNIDKIIKALFVLKKNIYELSKLGICVEDNYLGNILYDGNNFKLIDTGSYYYYIDIPGVNSFDEMFVYEKNMRKIVRMIFKNITNVDMGDDFILSFLWKIDSPYKSYLVDRDLLCNPDETIIGIRNIISEYSGYEIDNFSSCKKLLKKNR